MQSACRPHASGMQVGHMQAACRRGLQAACRWGVLWPTPPQGVQLHAVGMQAACRRHAGGAHEDGMQAGSAGGMQVGRAVANAAAGGGSCMQSRCKRHAGGACRWHAGGMQAACRWGALWSTPPQGVQLHAVGMQAGHAVGMQAGHAGGMQVGRAVPNAAARGASACSRHTGGMQAGRVQASCRRGACKSMQAGHAGGMQVGALRPTLQPGVQLHAVAMQAGHAGGMQAACRWSGSAGMQAGRRHAGGARCIHRRGMQAAGDMQVRAPWTRQNCQAKFNQIWLNLCANLKADFWLET